MRPGQPIVGLVSATALLLAAGVSSLAAPHHAAAQMVKATAVLAPQHGSKVTGKALLTLNPSTKVLTVVVTASGMVKNSTHPEHIHSGTCAHLGGIVYGLFNLKAGANGSGRSVTVIKGVKSIPAKGWLVNIHRGPTLAGTGATPISCGAVVVAASGGAAPATTSKWLTSLPSQKTADVTLSAGLGLENNGENFNGFSVGQMVITVPLGWKVDVHFTNVGSLPHSAMVVAGSESLSTLSPTLAFPGAETPNPVAGTAQGGSATFSFVAGKAGTYRIICAFPGHAYLGMWDTLIVRAGLASASIKT